MSQTETALSHRECLTKYLDTCWEQLDLLDPHDMREEDVVELYTRLAGKRRAKVLHFVLKREDKEELLLKLITRVVNGILAGERKSDVRLEELAEHARLLDSNTLQTLLRFSESKIRNAKRVNA